MSLTEEDAWGQWLADNDYTPESVREEIVNSFVDQELVKQGGEAEGITADPTEIDQYVETMRGHYDSDSAWAEALEAVGMTEDEYRDNIALSLVSQQLQEKVGEGAAEPTDEEVLESSENLRELLRRRERSPRTSCSRPPTRLRPRKCSTRSTPASSTSPRPPSPIPRTPLPPPRAATWVGTACPTS